MVVCFGRLVGWRCSVVNSNCKVGVSDRGRMVEIRELSVVVLNLRGFLDFLGGLFGR